MEWMRVVITCLFFLSSVLTVLAVNKPRQAITAGTAAGTLIFNALLIWAIWSL